MHIIITEIDSILSRIDLRGLKVLEPILTYKTMIWKQGPYAKKRIEILKKVYKAHGKEALFLTGFLPRIKLYLDSIGYTYEIVKLHDVEIGLKDTYRLKDKVSNKMITFRPDQIDLMDAAFAHKRGIIKSPTGCLVGETLIRLLDGTAQPIQNLVGKTNFYVLSSYNGEIVPGKVKRVWKTKMSKTLIRITLDNNTFIECTPEHPFLLKSGQYKPASELQPFDSLMPFSIKEFGDMNFKNRSYSEGYNYIYNPLLNKYEKLAHLVGRTITQNNSGQVLNIHHIDENKKNDNPENLKWLSVSEHTSLHLKTYHKHNIGRKQHLINHSEIQKQRSIRAWYNPDGSIKENRLIHEREKMIKLNKEISFHQKKCKIMKNLKKLLKYCSAEMVKKEFSTARNIAYSNGERYLPKKVNCIKYFGNLDNAIESAENYNHHVKSIKILKKIVPVYDMEVEKYHNFGIETSKGNGIFVHNSGKSILMMGIISRFRKNENILVLCHSAGIVKQLQVDFIKYFARVGMFGGDVDPHLKFEPLKHRIVLSTIQSFSKIRPENYCDYFSCVMADEAHRVSSLTGLYADVLQNMLAPYRFGFTATLPTTPEAQFAYEGLLGPMIAELSINQAAELNILAKPKLKIVKAGFPSTLRDIRDYHSVYEEGIVQNNIRNQQIASIIQDCQSREETSLVFVNKIAHGDNIERICNEQGIDVKFIQGSSDIETRERIRNELNMGMVKTVISTTVWKEGINIVNLNNVVNAAGGKSEIATLQAIGRGLRKTDTKDMVTIYDFFDPGHPYLIAHFGERMCLYCDLNWI